MKSQEDKHRSEREFQVGDMVYMKLQPYAQTSVARRSNHKLSFKFFGPYEILARIGKVAYKLKLPAGSHIHPVLHVSQLKKSVPPDQVTDSNLCFQFLTDECFVVQPIEVLATRQIKRGRGFITEVQVSWTGLPPSLTTWETEAALRQRFPGSTAWGQAVSQGEGPATALPTRSRRRRDMRRAMGRQPKKVPTQDTGPAHDADDDLATTNYQEA
jgi:hypothetical protein